MKEWVKALYIGYHQALDLPKNLFPFSRTRHLKISSGPTQLLYSKFHGLLKLTFHTNQYNGVQQQCSAYLILRCTFPYYVDEAHRVGCTGADVCSEQVGASCLQMVCPGPSCLQKQLLPAATNLHPPLQSLPCVQCGLTILGNPVSSSRVSLVVTSWDIVLFEAADRSRVLVQSG